MQTLQSIMRKYQPLLHCAFLILVFWVARYFHLSTFGLYEDDLALIPNAFQMTQGELFQYIGNYIISLHGHARPLANSLVYLFSNWGWHLGGLSGPYWLAFALQSVNLCLMVSLLKRVTFKPYFPLLGGLAYALFSADTTQAFLSVSLGMHQSITLLLIAAHVYLSGRRLLAYFIAGSILFAYETPYLVFLGVPLLKEKWGRSLLKELLTHGLVLGAMLILVFVLRREIGDGRVSGLSNEEIFMIPLLHMLQGPPVSLGSYFLRPWQALQAIFAGGKLAVEVALASLGGLIGFSWVIMHVQPAERTHRAALEESTPAPRWEKFRLAAAGAVMLVMAYPLTFTVRAYAISGRDTRVHAAAVVGAAILTAAVFDGLVTYLKNLQRTRNSSLSKAQSLLLPMTLALFPALLLGYGLVIQADYARAWQLQREFWTELIPLISDVEPGTVILVEPSGLEDTLQIGANTWNLPVVLEKSYRFPPGWGPTPRVIRMQPGWKERIAAAPGVFWLNAATVDAPETYYQQVDTFQIILITTEGGRLERKSAPLTLGGEDYLLKSQGRALLPPTCVQDCIPLGFLSTLLLLNSK